MNDENQIVCPSCGKLMDAGSVSCPNCFWQAGTSANLDPVGAIRGEGEMFQKAFRQKPKPIVVLGVWIMFLPAFILCSAVAVSTLSDQATPTSQRLIMFAAMAAGAFISANFLYRITRNYRAGDQPDRPR